MQSQGGARVVWPPAPGRQASRMLVLHAVISPGQSGGGGGRGGLGGETPQRSAFESIATNPLLAHAGHAVEIRRITPTTPGNPSRNEYQAEEEG